MSPMLRCLLIVSILLIYSPPTRAMFGRSSLGGSTEERTTTVVRYDGRCTVTNDTVLSRASAEQMVRFWQQMRTAAEGVEDDEPSATRKLPEAKPFTDQALADAIRKMAKEQSEESGDGSGIDALEVKSNAVRIVATRAFASLREMLQNASQMWGRSSLGIGSARFETTNGLLRVALTSYTGAARYAKRVRDQWKLSGLKAEWKLVLPGKIVSSDLPNKQENTTWISADAQKEETLQAALKVYQGTTVITAELSGLKLEEPLDSKTLQRYSRGGPAGNELPITDAGPGFSAEPVGITTTTVHYFPDGEKNLKDVQAFGYQSTGTVVRAKLFAPKGRSIRAVEGTRVLKAVDDKGRTIHAAEEDDEQDMSSEFHSHSGSSEDPISTHVQLRFGVPPADSKSIDELAAETIALTVGKWKTLTATNLKENQEIDLGSVLPRARMIISKLKMKNGQVSVQAKLLGPKAITDLDVQCKLRGNDQFHAYSYERNFTSTSESESVRTIDLQGYAFERDGSSSDTSALSAVVRFPEDLRRERVKFKLTGLDLF